MGGAKSLTVDEAKEIAHVLQLLVLKINGTKNEDGSTNTVGLIEQLENLYAKLNPTSIKFVGDLARKEVLESLQRIDELQNEQKSYFETQNFMFERRIKELIEEYEKINQEAKKIIISDFNEKAKTLRSGFNAELVDFKNHLKYHLDDIKELAPALNEVVNMRYMYVALFSITIFVTGMVAGTFLLK
ncbi:MAG: hypothetical protein PHS85_01825 [Sulfurovum sp.]|nr:hypothetical protein [Sulfurovum sp.]